jgi:putative flippase GtrA
MASVGELTRIARFLAVGVLNTIVGLAVIYTCKYFGQMSDVPANAIGYVVALTNSFAWNRRWTFAHMGRILPAATRFFWVFCIAYLANLATVMTVIGAFGVNSYLAHAIGAFPYTVLFYLGSRFFAFAR